MGVIVNLFISTAAVLIASYIIPGIQVADLYTAIVVAVVMGILNTVIKPILIFLTLPITIITLGLFTLVINAALVLLVDRLVPGFAVSGFLTALLFSLVLSIVGGFLNSMKSKED